MYNKFGKYNYRSFEGICEAVKPLLGECTLLATDEIQLIGNRFYVKADLTLTLVQDAGPQIITVSAYARETDTKKGMDDSQITGSSSSFARKYAANGLFLIDDTKDADTDEFAKESKKPKKKAPANKPAKTPPLSAIEPENTITTREDIIDKVRDSKVSAHLTNIYNKYSSQAQEEGWKDELIAECSRIKAVLQMGVGE